MIFEICAAVATLLFAVLVFYIVQTLKGLQKSLTHVDTLIETRIDPITEEAIDLTHSINEKIHALNALFEAIRKLGFMVQQSFESSRWRIKPIPEEKRPPWQEKMTDIIQLAALGLETWQKFKKRR